MRAADADEVEELRELSANFPEDDDGPNWLPRMQVCLGLAHDALQARRYDVAASERRHRPSARPHPRDRV